MPYIEKRIIAIYRITNKRSGKVYIGGSNNVLWRFYQHKNDLENGKHLSRKMQKDFRAEDSLKFEIIEILPNVSSLRVREQYWINQHGGSKHINCYNQNDVIPCPEWPEGWLEDLYVRFFGDGKFV